MERKGQILFILLLIGIYLPFTLSKAVIYSGVHSKNRTKDKIRIKNISNNILQVNKEIEAAAEDANVSTCSDLEENFNNCILNDDSYKERLSYSTSKIEKINDIKENLIAKYKDVETRYEALVSLILNDEISDEEKADVQEKECKSITSIIENNDNEVTSLFERIDKFYQNDVKNSKYFGVKIRTLKKYINDCESNGSCKCGNTIDSINKEIEKLHDVTNEISKCKYVFPLTVQKIAKSYKLMKESCNSVQGPHLPLEE